MTDPPALTLSPTLSPTPTLFLLPPFRLLLPHLFLLLSLVPFTEPNRRLPAIYWNKNNRMFTQRRDDYVIHVRLGDSIDIHCPQAGHGGRRKAEYYKLYQVSKAEYDSCVVNLTHANPSITKWIFDCEPFKASAFRVNFARFSPLPQGLEFEPGQDYHFISTSTSDLEGTDNLKGGVCKSHHMKVTFRVCCKQDLSYLLNSHKQHIHNGGGGTAGSGRRHHGGGGSGAAHDDAGSPRRRRPEDAGVHSAPAWFRPPVIGDDVTNAIEVADLSGGVPVIEDHDHDAASGGGGHRRRGDRDHAVNGAGSEAAFPFDGADSPDRPNPPQHRVHPSPKILRVDAGRSDAAESAAPKSANGAASASSVNSLTFLVLTIFVSAVLTTLPSSPFTSPSLADVSPGSDVVIETDSEKARDQRPTDGLVAFASSSLSSSSSFAIRACEDEKFRK